MGVFFSVSGIDLASFYDFSIGFINFLDRVVFFNFINYIKNHSNISQ